MNADIVMAMELQFGRLMHALYDDRLERIPPLFCRQRDILFSMPDRGIHCHRAGDLPDALGRWKRQLHDAGILRELYLSHSPAFRVSDDGTRALGCWGSAAFQIGAADGEGRHPVSFYYARFDAEFALEDGSWKFLRLNWYDLLSTIPQAFSLDGAAAGLLPAPLAEDAGGAAGDPDDYAAIELLQSRASHLQLFHAGPLFSDAEDCTLSIPGIVEEATGHGAVLDSLHQLEQRQRENGVGPLLLPMVYAPLIRLHRDGMTADGAFLTILHRLPRHDSHSFDVLQTIGRLEQTYVRENGRWKIHTYRFRPLFTLSRGRFDLDTCRGAVNLWPDGWNSPPPSAPGAGAADLFEIQTLLGRWTTCLKSYRFAAFFRDWFAYREPGVGARLNTGDWRLEHPVRENPGLEGLIGFLKTWDNNGKRQRKTPGNHTGTTPLVSVDPDGIHAVGVWFDYGWTLMGPAFTDAPPPYVCAPSFGRYELRFFKEDGVWKLHQFQWELMFQAEANQCDPKQSRGWCGTCSRRKWPLAFQPYVRCDDPMDETDERLEWSDEIEQILTLAQIREIQGFLDVKSNTIDGKAAEHHVSEQACLRRKEGNHG